jgi:hypothetical protein
MEPGIISHVSDPCANIKSKKESRKRCENLATHGTYCWRHHRNPIAWIPPSPEYIAHRVAARRKKRSDKVAAASALAILQNTSAAKIAKWYTFWRGLRLYERHGPAMFARDLCTNDSDFFSTDAIKDISGFTFFSYKDSDNHVYGFDVRSLHMLITRARLAGNTPTNPFTRAELPTMVVRSLMSLVSRMKRWNMMTEWAPLTPPTPEQQMHMKIVDLFGLIDELNYYSSPDWFIDLDSRAQARFYRELYDLWTHRAGLTYAQKEMMVPNFHTRLFRHPPWAVASHSLETLRRLNMNAMRLMITSATDRNDRILGAMYVMTALTTVSNSARTAYPWLHESIAGDTLAEFGAISGDIIIQGERARGGDPARRNALVNLLGGIGWIADLLAPTPPPLLLPPAAPIAEEDTDIDTGDDD